MLKSQSVFFLLALMLSSLACMQSAALSSSSPTLTPTATTTRALTVASLVPEPLTTSEPAHCKVIAQAALNLRNGAGVSFGVIAWLTPGEILTLTNQPARGAWIEVTTASNTTGWINSLYCER